MFCEFFCVTQHLFEMVALHIWGNQQKSWHITLQNKKSHSTIKASQRLTLFCCLKVSFATKIYERFGIVLLQGTSTSQGCLARASHFGGGGNVVDGEGCALNDRRLSLVCQLCFKLLLINGRPQVAPTTFLCSVNKSNKENHKNGFWNFHSVAV